MRRRTAVILLLTLLLLAAAPSLADTFSSLYASLMAGYSDSARDMAAHALPEDVGLSLTADEAKIYALGLARGYDLGSGAPTAGASGKLVWIPQNGGSKYHSKPNCGNLKEPRQVSLEDAVRMGYEACKTCKP